VSDPDIEPFPCSWPTIGALLSRQLFAAPTELVVSVSYLFGFDVDN